MSDTGVTRGLAPLAAAIVSALAAGCGRPAWTPTDEFRRDDPRAQTAAIARVVNEGDRGRIPELIALLDSEDEGVRFAAASALHRLTGEDFGVYYAGTDEERARRIEMWHTWWDETGRHHYGDAAGADTASASPAPGDDQP